MPIEITARHMHATDNLQTYAREQAEQMLEDFPIVEHIHVILDLEKHGILQKAEVVVQVKRHGTMEAAESSENFRASIDAAFEKASKQVQKVTDKGHDHKPAMKQKSEQKERS